MNITFKIPFELRCFNNVNVTVKYDIFTGFQWDFVTLHDEQTAKQPTKASFFLSTHLSYNQLNSVLETNNGLQLLSYGN